MYIYRNKSELIKTRPRVSFGVLLALIMMNMGNSCVREERTPAKITFIEPNEQDLNGFSWTVGDSLLVVFHAEVTTGDMLPIEVGLGQYSTNDQAVRKPDKIILHDTFKTNRKEQIFTIRWKLMDTITPSGEKNHYRLLFSPNSERQPVNTFPSTMINVKVTAKNF